MASKNVNLPDGTTATIEVRKNGSTITVRVTDATGKPLGGGSGLDHTDLTIHTKYPELINPAVADLVNSL